MTTYTGKQILMETFLAEGVEYIFGNPGTTELPLVDSLVDYPRLKYILSLQEAVAVSMADAYAHASGSVGVVNLHVGPGLGNGLGSVYNAWEGQTPLVVTAGQQDARMRLREPLLSHDLVAMAAPLTKWSVEAQSADELPLLLNRAFKTARETPSGPVFVSLPMNVMEQHTEHAPLPPSRIYSRNAPDPDGIEQAAALLLGAKQPAIICGDKVASSSAVPELIDLAERLGAPVYSEILPARMSFPNQHPHYRERLPHDQAQIRARIGSADVVLLVGGEFFEEVWFVDVSPFAEGVALIQIDPSPPNVGRNYPVHCGITADPKPTLQALIQALGDKADEAFANRAAERCELLREQKQSERVAQTARANQHHGNRRMSTARLMAELAAALPDNVSIAGEAITAGPDMLRSLDFRNSTDYLASRGGGIGQGLPSAIGLKLAYPERPVLCVSGDGSALYTIQALWTAAHHRIPVVFLILNNRSYRILKLNMNRYRGASDSSADRGYPHLDLTEPVIDFVSVARGFGVEAQRIEDPSEMGAALKTAFESNRPWLLDVLIDESITT